MRVPKKGSQDLGSIPQRRDDPVGNPPAASAGERERIVQHPPKPLFEGAAEQGAAIDIGDGQVQMVYALDFHGRPRRFEEAQSFA